MLGEEYQQNLHHIKFIEKLVSMYTGNLDVGVDSKNIQIIKYNMQQINQYFQRLSMNNHKQALWQYCTEKSTEYPPKLATQRLRDMYFTFSNYRQYNCCSKFANYIVTLLKELMVEKKKLLFLVYNNSFTPSISKINLIKFLDQIMGSMSSVCNLLNSNKLVRFQRYKKMLNLEKDPIPPLVLYFYLYEIISLALQHRGLNYKTNSGAAVLTTLSSNHECFPFRGIIRHAIGKNPGNKLIYYPLTYEDLERFVKSIKSQPLNTEAETWVILPKQSFGYQIQNFADNYGPHLLKPESLATRKFLNSTYEFCKNLSTSMNAKQVLWQYCTINRTSKLATNWKPFEPFGEMSQQQWAKTVSNQISKRQLINLCIAFSSCLSCYTRQQSPVISKVINLLYELMTEKEIPRDMSSLPEVQGKDFTCYFLDHIMSARNSWSSIFSSSKVERFKRIKQELEPKISLSAVEQYIYLQRIISIAIEKRGYGKQTDSGNIVLSTLNGKQHPVLTKLHKLICHMLYRGEGYSLLDYDDLRSFVGKPT